MGGAVALYPAATNATRNRQVYTPVQAILRHAGVNLVVRRPRGAQGTPRKAWLRPEDAAKLLDAAWTLHPRFAALCTVLLYTGCRLSEALAIQVADIHLEAGFIDLADTKNGEPQRLHLPPIAAQAVRRLTSSAYRPSLDRTIDSSHLIKHVRTLKEHIFWHTLSAKNFWRKSRSSATQRSYCM